MINSKGEPRHVDRLRIVSICLPAENGSHLDDGGVPVGRSFSVRPFRIGSSQSSLDSFSDERKRSSVSLNTRFFRSTSLSLVEERIRFARGRFSSGRRGSSSNAARSGDDVPKRFLRSLCS